MKTITMSCLLLAGLTLAGQTSNTSEKLNYVALEADPAPFVLGGYSFSLKYSHEHFRHFTFMGSVYASPMPNKLLGKNNYNNGLRDLEIETSYALFVDYFLRSDRSGLHFGPSVFLYNKSVGSLENNMRSDFSSVYPNLRIGYMYKPFKSCGIYLNPWFNIGKEFALGSKASVNEVAYEMPAFSYILALHIGYQFTL